MIPRSLTTSKDYQANIKVVQRAIQIANNNLMIVFHILGIPKSTIILCGPGYRIGPPCSLLMHVVKGDKTTKEEVQMVRW